MNFASNQSELIVNQAKLYLKTPFHHQGRSKHGLDCIGLVVRVLDDLGIELNGKPANYYDNCNYGREPAAPFLTAPLDALFKRVNDVQIGDVLLFKINEAPRHVGIVTDIYKYNNEPVINFIHAYQPFGAVRTDDLGIRWRKRLMAIYRLPNMEN